MINSFFNKPLYPSSDTPETQPNQNQTNQKGFGSSLQNILPLLMGMNKGSNMENLASMLTKNMPQSPLFDMLSSFTKQNNKKESSSSPKKIPDEEYF